MKHRAHQKADACALPTHIGEPLLDTERVLCLFVWVFAQIIGSWKLPAKR